MRNRALPPPLANLRAGAAARAWPVALTASLAMGCGAEFDPPSEIDALRVIAVQKSAPYARPGEEVELAMLYHDGADAAPRELTVAWYHFCSNPPFQDAYYSCLRPLGAALSDGVAPVLGEAALKAYFEDPGAPLDPSFAALGYSRGVGDRFSFRMVQPWLPQGPGEGPPAEPLPIALRPPETPEQPPSGVAFVFFAACAGELRFDPSVLSPELRFDVPARMPLRCVDGAGRALGPEDFVVGYSTVYAFEELRNANPVVEGITFDGARFTPDPSGITCVDDACIDTRRCEEETGSACGSDAECCSGACTRELGAERGTCAAPSCERMPCVDACRGDDCPTFDVLPLVPEDVAEFDAIASAGGDRLQEQMWVTYGVDGGSVANEVRLVNDATGGFNADLGTEYEPPAEPGYAQLWAVVRDNRGGAGWVRQRIYVR